MITILIPIHKFGDEERQVIVKCFESISRQNVKNYNVLIATFADYVESISNANSYDLDLNFHILDSNLIEKYPNYVEIVNSSVKVISSDYFTVLQLDDVLNNTFTLNAEKYSKAYPSVAVFLPIVLEFNGETFTKSLNESVWNIDFTEKQGYLDFETMRKFNVFSFVSAIYKTVDFKEENGYKPTIKKYFEHEYFLRILYKAYEVMVIPKFMVRHTVDRPGSLSKYYEDNLEKLEEKFYFDLARKEYFFDEDRNIIYQHTQ